MKTRPRKSLVALIFICATAGAADWPQWRGPEGSGHSAEDSQYDAGAWPPGDAAWSKSVGEGCTSPVVAGGKLFVMGWKSGRDRVHCLDAASGAKIWETSYASPRYGRHSLGDQGIYSGVTSTPTYDAPSGRLFALSCDGELSCLDAADGNRLWSVNLYDDHGGRQRPRVGRSGHRDYGYTTSPLVYGDWVVVEAGSAGGAVMAFDKASGRRVWASQSKDFAGHTGGLVPITVEDVPCLTVLTFSNLLVLRVDGGHEGETVAEYPWVTDFANSIATPAVSGSSVVITAGYNHHAICRVDISLAGAKKAWELDGACSKVCSPVIHEGRIYWAWQNLCCVELKTGKLLWRGETNLGDAGSCIVTADDRLIVWSHRGKLQLVDTAARSLDRCRVLAETGPLYRTDAWPHIVLAEGRLYCKDRDGNLKCIELRGK